MPPYEGGRRSAAFLALPIDQRGVAELARRRRLWVGTTGILGRDASADDPLGHPSVSVKHEEIRGQPDKVQIGDLDSTNETFVDGVR